MSTQAKIASVLVTAGLVAAAPVMAHHSFSIFDAEQTKTFTGVVTRVNPDANHLQIFFAPMNDERKGVVRNAEGKPVTSQTDVQAGETLDIEFRDGHVATQAN